MCLVSTLFAFQLIRMRFPTGGVSGVDDAEDSRLAVLFSSLVRSVELVNIQRPAVVFVKVVIDLHGTQLRDGGGVKRVLRDGDHHPGTVTTFTRHQQLQNALRNERKSVRQCFSTLLAAEENES